MKKRKRKIVRRKGLLKASLPLLVATTLFLHMQKPQVAHALMPIEQWSTGQITSGALSWDILGRSMILNDVQTNVTSVSKHDAAILYSKDEATRRYTSGHTYKQYQNGERVIEESLYVEMFGVNKFGWSNNAFRVTPANFDRNATVLGRSLLDNLYREGYNNNTLDGLLGKTSHAWLNGILTLRTASWPTHSTMHKDKLWKTGSANYSLARQVHVTKKAANAGAWSAQVKKDINILFEKKVGLPIIDDTPPVITVTPNSADWSSSARTVSISAHDNGVGLKELRTRQKLNSDDWGGWSAYQTGSTKSIKLSASGSYTLQVQATDRNGNSKTHTTGAIKVDVTAPTHAGETINGARYVNGNTHWFRPNDSFEIDLSGYDRDSTMRYTYLRLSNANNDNRSVYDWESTNTSNLNTWMLGNYTEITGGKRDYWGYTPRYKYYTKVKSNASGQTLDVQYYYTDRVGHTNGYHSTGKTIKVDGVAPVTTLTASNTTWKNTDQSVTLTMSDALSGLKDVRWRISQDDGGTWGAWTDREKAGASKTLNFNSNGRWRVQFQVRDNVDYTTNAEGRWFIDKSAPVLNLGGSPTSWTKEDVNLTWSLYDNGGSGFKNIKLPNGSFSTATSGTFAAGSNGTYSFTAYDNAGNTTTQSITVSHIDKVIPVHEKVLMHDFRYQDGNTYWYHEGDVARIAMQQADADSRIKFGYLRLYGDGNDNRASYNWVVNNNTVNEFQKTGGFTNISPNSANYYNISAIYIFNARMNATAINKTFQVHSYAEDNAGNTFGYTDTGVRVRTDSTPPTISPNTVPSEWINTNPTVTLTFADGQSGIKTKQYAWSTSTTTPTAWTNYTAPVTQAVAGTWYLHARATDNTGRQTVQRYGPYRIDKTAPNGTISGNPTSWTKNSQTLTVAVSDTGGSGYYRTLLPNGAYSTSTAPTYGVSANGTYSFVIYDHAGNSRTVTAVVDRIDTTVPTGSVSGNPTAWTRNDITLTMNGADSQSGVAYILDHNGNRTNGATDTFVVSGNGTYKFTVYDHAGNSSVINTTVTKIDKTIPDLNITQSPTNWTNGNVTLIAQATDTGGSGVAYILDHNGNRTNGATDTFVATANGTYAFTIYDNAGNSRVVNHTVSNIERVKPTGTVTQSPTVWTNGNVTLTASAADTGGSGVAYILDQNGNRTNGASDTFVATANGTYQFTIFDNAGNSQVITRVVTNIERTKPTATISQSPTNWTNGNVVLTLNASDTGGSGVYRVKDPAGNFTTGALDTYTVTQNGTYTFTVYDHAGNSQDVSHTVSNIDKTAPGGTVSGNPTAWTNTNITLTIKATDAGVSGVSYILDPAGNRTNGSNASFVVSANGTYAFTVYDNAGNSTVISTSVTRIDKTLPGLTVTKSTTAWTNGKVTLTANATDDQSGISRMQDPAGAYTNGGTATYTVSANGTYTFIAYDVAGNARTVTTSVTNIDTLKPTGSITQSPTNWTNGNVVLTLNASDTGGSGVYRVKDPAGNFTTGALDTYTVTQNGTYTFTVYDHAGNSQDVSHTVSNIDKTAPGGTVSGNPTAWTNTNITLTIKPTDAGVSGVSYILDPAGNRTNGSNASFVVSANGTYAFTVYDNAGNSTVISTSVTRIDKTLPGLTVTKSTTAWTNGKVTLTANATDGQSGISRIQDPAGAYTNGGTATYTVSANGTYTFIAYDVAGNARTVTTSVTNIDTLKPTGSITQSPTAWTKGNVTLTLQASDTGGSDVNYILDNNGNRTYGATDSFVATTNGTYTFTIYDHAGNSTVVSHVVSNIDKTNPVGTVSGNPTAWTANNVTLTLKATDIGSGVDYILDHNGNKTLGATDTFVVTTNGTYTFTIYDKVGNSTIVSTTVSKIDKVKPVVSAKRLQTTWSGKAIEIEVTASDAQSGLKDVTFVSGPGRNLIRNSNAFTMNNSDHGNSNLTKVMQDENGLPYHTVTPVKNGNIYWNNGMAFSAPRVSGKTYTLSFDVKTTQSQNWGFYFYTDTNRVISNVASTNGEWKRHTYTFTQTETKSNNILFGFHGLLAGKEISWRNLKLEEGAGTPWSYAPEDATMTSGKIKFSAATNGDYVFRATDNVGNTQDVTVTVTNVDHDAPTLTIQPSTTAWTNQDVTLTITMNDGDGSGINRIILPNGTVKRFVGTGVQTMDFTVRKNGTYTFVLEDNVGNTDTFLHTVTNIDKTPPSQSTIEVKVGN